MNVDAIIKYENGELFQDEIVELFQELVDTGDAWRLQGSYGRMAAALIDAGLVSLHEEEESAVAVGGELPANPPESHYYWSDQRMDSYR
jgi:hypothetical protein